MTIFLYGGTSATSFQPVIQKMNFERSFTSVKVNFSLCHASCQPNYNSIRQIRIIVITSIL